MHQSLLNSKEELDYDKPNNLNDVVRLLFEMHVTISLIFSRFASCDHVAPL